MRLFFLLALLPFFVVFPYLRGVNNPNELVRVFTTMELVEHGTLSIDDAVKQFGWVNDMAHVPPKPGAPPRYVMVKTPLSTYLGVPAYFVYSKVARLFGRHYPIDGSTNDEKATWLRSATWVCRIFAVQIPCYLFLIFFERYMRYFVPDVVLRLTTVAAAGFGTNYLAYTHIYASHTLYACSAFMAFAITERAMRTNRWTARGRKIHHAFFVGFLAGACVAFEYHALFVAVILSIFGALVFRRPLQLLALGLGGGIPAAIVAHFQWCAYGDPLKPGHQVLETPSFAAAHQKGFFGVQIPQMPALKALSLDLGFGFFSLSPFMWFVFLLIPCVLLWPGGPPILRRARRVSAFVVMLILLAMFGVASGIVEWRGGWTVGPRYLAGAPPLCAFACGLVLQRLSERRRWRPIVRGVAGGLAIAGVFSIGVVGLVYDTLPEQLPRPLSQFALPFVYLGYVPHHIFEWFGWMSIIPWYVACAAMLTAVGIAVLWRSDERRRELVLRLAFVVLAACAGLAPAFSTPEDTSAVLGIHPSVMGVLVSWEPLGRDRITAQKEEAERYGPRRPCNWFRLADLYRIASIPTEAAKDEEKAHAARGTCPRDPYLVVLEALRPPPRR